MSLFFSLYFYRLKKVYYLFFSKGNIKPYTFLFWLYLFFYSTAIAQPNYENQLEYARQLNQGNKAQEAYSIAHDIATQLSKSSQKMLYSDALTVEGNALRRLRQWDMAIQSLKKALTIRQNIKLEQLIPVANACQNLAHVYMDLGDFLQALPLLLRAKSIREKKLPAQHNDIFKVYAPLAETWNELKKPDSTINLLSKYIQNPPPQYQAVFLMNYGVALAQKRVWHEAQSCFEKIWTLQGTEPLFKTNSYINLSNIALEKGEMALADAYVKKAIGTINTHIYENNIETGNVFVTMASVKRRLGLLSNAANLLEQAVGIFEQNNLQNRLYDVYLNLAIVLREQRDFRASQFYLSKIFNNSNIKLSNSQQAKAQFQQALNFYHQQLYKDATIHFEKVISLLTSIKHDTLFESELYLAASQNAIKIKSFNKAEFYLKKSRELLIYKETVLDEALYLRYLAIDAQYNTALASVDKKGCFEKYLKAIKYLEAILASQNERTSVLFWQKEYNFLFDEAIEYGFQLSAIDAKYKNVVLELIEKSKNIWYQRTRQIRNLRKQLSEKDVLKLNSLKKQIAFLENERLIASNKSRYLLTTPRLTYLDSMLFALKKEYQVIESKIGVGFTLSPIPASQIQAQLTENQAIISYHISETDIYIISITHGNIDIQKTNKSSDWVAKIMRYYQAMSTPPQYLGQKERLQTELDFNELSYYFYTKLIEPIKHDIEDKNGLIIIPDAELSLMPFETLTKSFTVSKEYHGLDFLISSYDIHYNLSINDVLSPKVKQKTIEKIVLFAPKFDKKQSGLDPLPANEKEIQTIKEIIGGSLFLNDNAAKDKFLTHANTAQIIHLATHGFADGENSGLSWIAFAQDRDSSKSLFLNLQEIEGLETQADLVVLSACQTNIGAFQTGEGILSIARGFIYSGTQCVVSTLWKVDDYTTASLTTLFYENLKRGMTKSHALCEAKRQFLQQNATYQNPFYWAALTQLGADSPLSFSNFECWLPLSILSVLLLVGVIYWRYRKIKIVPRKGFLLPFVG